MVNEPPPRKSFRRFAEPIPGVDKPDWKGLASAALLVIGLLVIAFVTFKFTR